VSWPYDGTGSSQGWTVQPWGQKLEREVLRGAAGLFLLGKRGYFGAFLEKTEKIKRISGSGKSGGGQLAPNAFYKRGISHLKESKLVNRQIFGERDSTESPNQKRNHFRGTCGWYAHSGTRRGGGDTQPAPLIQKLGFFGVNGGGGPKKSNSKGRVGSRSKKKGQNLVKCKPCGQD